MTNDQITNSRLRTCLIIDIWSLVFENYLELGKLVIGICLMIGA
jgi:hypothetical protein